MFLHIRNQLFAIAIAIFSLAPLNAQVYFYENFESGISEDKWFQEQETGNLYWTENTGGYEVCDDVSGLCTRFPNNAYQGNYNAYFQVEVHRGWKTKLITQPLDLTGAKKPEILFWHAQDEWGPTDFDRLRVFCKNNVYDEWILLNKYLEPLVEWTEQSIFIPDSLLSDSVYVAFEGETNYGYGICIDSIKIIEKGIIPKHITRFEVNQYNDDFVASGVRDNPVINMSLTIFGNEGDLYLDSLNIRFKGSNVNDVSTSGVNVYITENKYFKPHNPVTSPVSFIDSVASFKNINYRLPYGKSYLWITCDAHADASEGNVFDLEVLKHNVHIHLDTSDMSFEEENIANLQDSIMYIVYDTNYALVNYVLPDLTSNPAGERSIKDKYFFDDFETDTNWYFGGDFEIDRPMGLGANELRGFPDPDTAYSGYQVLGSDLSFDGDHGNFINPPDTAMSKCFNLQYFKDLFVGYQLWLNKESYDFFNIQVSADSGITWNTIRNYDGDISQNYWKFEEIDLSAHNVDRQKEVIFKFNLGPTDGNNVTSGWNIDNFIIAGNFVTSDVGVTRIISPLGSCGMTDQETFSVIVKNFGAWPSNDTIPVYFSLDGGNTRVYDTIFQEIPVGDSILYDFQSKADFSTPKVYNVIVSTDLDGDEEEDNNSRQMVIVSQPYVELPYAENFESENGFWANAPFHAGWSCKEPGIPSPGGGKAWVSNTGSVYKNLDTTVLVSPCFDFTNTEKPIIDFYYSNATESGKDGTLLQYTTDGGVNWAKVDSHAYEFDWEWYTDSVNALGTTGWTGSSVWKRTRQFLPSTIENEANVKFRFVFASDSNNTDIGFRFDEVKIYEAPHDIGVVSIDSIGDACQFVNPENISFTVKNFGVRSMKTGDTIVAGMNITNNESVIDTFVLADELPVNDSVTLKFNKKADLTQAGLYDVAVYTFIEDDPYYYGEVANDTAYFSFNIHQNPYTHLPDTIKSARPDTLTLIPYYHEDYEYEWQPGNINDSVYHVSVAGDYELTVTNTDSTGCITYDTVNVHQLIPDISITAIHQPQSTCELDSVECLTVEVTNVGSDTLNVNDTILISYEFEANPVVTDTFLVYERFYPDSSLYFTFNDDTVDLHEFRTYNFKLFNYFTWDQHDLNDTLETSITTFGYPIVDLGEDVTIYTLSHTLDAGPSFIRYEWSTADTTQTVEVYDTDDYWVTATDANGCPGSDTVHVRFDYLDVGLTALINPVNSCLPLSSGKVMAQITNTGTDTIVGGATIDIAYQRAHNDPVLETMTISGDFYPDSTLIHEFAPAESFDTAGNYYFQLYTIVAGDINPANDTLTDTIVFYPYPELELGADTVIRDYEYTLQTDYDSSYSYLWNTGEDTSMLLIDQPGTYSLSVTSPFGCETTDSRHITLIVPDLNISSIVYPGDECKPREPIKFRFLVLNNGTDTISSSDNVKIGYTINDGEVVEETLSLSQDLMPNTSTVHTFAKSETFPDAGNYQISTYIDYDWDINNENDTLTRQIEFYTLPVVDLGNDTIIKSLTYELIAGTNPTYTYHWQDGSTRSVYVAESTGNYSVTVTSEHDCETSDDVYLDFRFPDIGVTSLVEPTDLCSQNEKELVVLVENLGSDTLMANDTFGMGYLLNGQPVVLEECILSENIIPGATMEHHFSNKVDMSDAGYYDFKIFTSLNRDLARINDTLSETIHMLESPHVDFGTDDDTLRVELPHILNAGDFETYEWSSGQTNRSMIVVTPGQYSVTVTNVNACEGSGSIYVDTTLVSGIETAGGSTSIEFYPNPASDVIHVEATGMVPGSYLLEIVDINGKTLINKEIDLIKSYRTKISIEQLPRGMYLLKISNKRFLRTYHIIKD